jgi:signal transduction histidine kinase
MYVTMMAIYYAKILASGAELESEMRHHLATAAELRRATTEAERAGVAKAEFLAKMSHELRTPLNAVIGYSEILLEDALADGESALAADLQKIRIAGQQLLKLINEILELSKIEAGRMELLIETVDVTDLVTRAVESCRGAAVMNGNELVLNLIGDPGDFACDSSKVEKAIAQLLDNAAKFTENGRITVTVGRRAGAAGDEVIIAVRDTGIGIAPELIHTLFEKFSVAEDSSSSKYGGTGLGLALSQKMCGLMGGEITVESSLGAGSCFTIRLPTERPGLASKAVPVHQQAGDGQVLPRAA